MSLETEAVSARDAAWDRYWLAGQEQGTWGAAGEQDEALARFWLQWFDERSSGAQILDVGCGNGALIAIAEAVAERRGGTYQMTCIDRSAAAVEDLHRRHPDATCLASDAASISLPDDCFDAVISQYGIEYAGEAAAAEAARLLAPGGHIAFVIHCRDGGVFRECDAVRSALGTVLDSGLFDATVDLFEQHAQMRKGQGSQSAFYAADQRLAPTVKVLEQQIQQHGKAVAFGSLYRIYSDLGYMYRHMRGFEAADVIDWARRSEAELSAYAERMESMLQAALNEAGIERWCEVLRAGGIDCEPPQTLQMGDGDAVAAWVVKGQKPQG